MISNVNGNYFGLSYGICSDEQTSTNISPSTSHDSKIGKSDQPDEIHQNFNQLSRKIPLNTVDRIEESTANKEIVRQPANSQPDNIGSIITLIESSRKISEETTLVDSEDQSMAIAADSLNNKKAYVSYNKVLAFLNQY